MVSFLNCASCSGSGADGDFGKRRRMDDECPAAETSGSAQRRQTSRQRKQKLLSKLSDSGFEEDLESDRTCCSEGQAAVEHLSSWYLQYGDVGYRIQREKEAQYHPCTSLARQPQLTSEARCKLVSWLVPVHKHLRLSFECCCLAVNIMDRFLASTAVAADCFQLLGVTALLLASKQVEVCSPRISHLLSLCCDTFTKEQLCNLECLVLVRLDFCLSVPTLAFFLDYYTNCNEAEKTDNEQFAGINSDSESPRRWRRLAQKVCELSLADYAFNKYPPSLTASCALGIARDLLQTDDGGTGSQGPWDCSMADLLSRPAPVRSPEGYRTVKGHFLPVDEEGRDSLVQECRDNLKLLVSLNQESLDVTAAM